MFPAVILLIGAPWQVAIILIVVLLLFSKRIPELMRSLGASASEFKKGIKHGNDDDDSDPAKS